MERIAAGRFAVPELQLVELVRIKPRVRTSRIANMSQKALLVRECGSAAAARELLSAASCQLLARCANNSLPAAPAASLLQKRGMDWPIEWC